MATRYSTTRRVLGYYMVLIAAHWLSCDFSIAAPGDLLFKIPAPDSSPDLQKFGFSMAVADGDILVGAPWLSIDDQPFVGQAYLFDGDDGSLIQRIPFPGEPNERPQFGDSVAANDGALYIIAPSEDRVDVFGNGTIYAFDRRGRELFSVDHPHDVSFFNLAAVPGGVITSDPSKSVDGQRSAGIAYVVDGTTGDITSIPNPEPESGDSFGAGRYSLSAFDDQIVVGTYLEEPNGSVFVIDKKTGSITARLDNPEPTFGDILEIPDLFGDTVATVDSKVLVGAKLQEVGRSLDAGSIYVFDGYSGDLLLTIDNPEPDTKDEFGTAITAFGRDILVAAPRDEVNGVEAAGAVYLFDGETGEMKLKIPNPEPAAFSMFGESIGAWGDKVYVGAPQAMVGGIPAGAVYAFEGVPEPRSGHLFAIAIFVLSSFHRRNNNEDSFAI